MRCYLSLLSRCGSSCPFGVAFAILLTLVHVYVSASGLEYAGFLLFVDHFFNIALVLSLLALFSAVGLWILRWFRCQFGRPLESLLFSLPIGCGAISISILILGFSSGLQPITLTGLLASWLFLAKSEIQQVFRWSIQASIEIKEKGNAFSLTVLALVTAFMVSRALLPPTDWDSLMYHLRLPAQFLEAGKIVLPEDSLHVAYVQLVHMLYLPLLAYGSLSGPALLSVFFALFLGLAIFALCDRFFGSHTADLSFQLLWSSTIVLLTAITPRIDVTFAYFLFVAHFALLLSSINSKCFYLSAVFLGLAVGVKYTALIYVLALSPIIVWVVWSSKRSFVSSVFRLVCFGLIFIATSLPWFLKNWWMFQAPLYPLFAQRRIEPWLAFLYSEKFIPKSADASMLTMLSEVRAPFNVVDLFVNPGALSIEGEAAFYFFSPVLLGLVFWILFSRNALINALVIPAIGYVAVLILYSPHTNLRYLIPALAPLTIASVYSAVSLIQAYRWAGKAFVIVQCCALFALFPTAVVMQLWSSNGPATHYLLGTSPAGSYLKNNSVPPYYRVFAATLSHLNRHLSPTSRVLMLFEARGFYFNVQVIQDNVLTNWPLLANRASEIDCLTNTEITHVLVNFADLNNYLHRGLNPATIRWDVFRQFADRCLVQVFQGPGHDLYEVRRRVL